MPLRPKHYLPGLWRALSCAALLLLVACTTRPPEVVEETLPGGGGTVPRAAVEGFFEDLNKALADPRLAEDYETRVRWAEQLAGYFAPVERQRQRIAMGRMLDDVAASLRKLADEAGPDEQMQVLLEARLQPTELRVLSQEATRAELHLGAATLHLKIARLRDGRQDPIYEQSEPLYRLLGRNDGSVPLVRVDGRWFLSSS
jgi:hypothetical protein